MGTSAELWLRPSQSGNGRKLGDFLHFHPEPPVSTFRRRKSNLSLNDVTLNRKGRRKVNLLHYRFNFVSFFLIFNKMYLSTSFTHMYAYAGA